MLHNGTSNKEKKKEGEIFKSSQTQKNALFDSFSPYYALF